MKTGNIGEFGLIDRLAGTLGAAGDRVLRGIGDDAAVLEGRADRLLLATCDIQIQGVHFVSGAIEPVQIGSRVAAVNLSDIAAMGGSPLWALVSLTVPPSTEVEYLEEIYRGMAGELSRSGARIVGGNTSSTSGPLTIDMTLVGEVERENLLTRDGARVGDALCVTGDLGSSAAGLFLNQNKSAACDAAVRESLVHRHLIPSPRIEQGRMLGATDAVTACIDLSDGLFQDAGHIAQRSGVGVCIHAEEIPVSADVRTVATSLRMDWMDLALGGGEDYELLFTADPVECDGILARVKEETGVSARKIGEIVDGAPGVIVIRDGKRIDPAVAGFDHFESGGSGC